MNRPNTTFPAQFIAESEKTQEWCDQMINAIMGYITGTNSPFDSSRSTDIQSYNIYNGHINRDSYKYVTEQYGTTYPARLVNYPIIQPKIDLLLGEDLKRPLDYKVSTVNKDAVVRKEDFKVSLMMNALLKDIHKEIKEESGVEIDMEGQELSIPEDIDTYMRYNYREMVEEVAQDGLEYIINSYGLKEEFKNGFRDLLVTGKEFYKVYVSDGDPRVRRVDPRSIIYDVGLHSDFIDDAQWVGEERWLTINEIMDEYRDELTKDDMEELSNMTQLVRGGEDYNIYNAYFQWLDWDARTGIRVRVLSCEWKSIRALKFKISENKYNPESPFKKLVADDYKPRKNEVIETRYVDDIWEGTKIGGKILIKCKRRDNQVRSVDDAGKADLSYVGVLKNNSAGRTMSMITLMKSVQMLYNIVMYHIELAMARSGGKAVVYDVSQMPANIGMDMQTVMYHIKNDGIIPINSKDEGNQAHTFNQFQQVDFTLSNSVQQLINLKLMLEETAGHMSGVSRQREGSVGQYEMVGNVQRSVVQSALITETWFHSHNECKKRVMERLCDLMKIAWGGGKKAATILGDGAYKFLSVMPEISLNDYGVYVGDSGKDESMKQVLGQLAQSALQSGQIDFMDVIKVLKADSMTEAEHILERGMDEMRKMQQQQAEAEQQAAQAEAQAKQAEFESQAQLKQMDNDTKIEIAKMNNDAKVKVAEIYSDDLRDIADMKEKSKLDGKVLDKELGKKEDSMTKKAAAQSGMNPKVMKNAVDSLSEE